MQKPAAAPLSVVYTPLNGTGLECVSAALGRIGVNNVTLVPGQDEPNGDFPTCPYPNPEIREALEEGIKVCEERAANPETRADLLLATDPDADRVGVACADGDDYTLITGNEMGVLLMDYIARCKAARGESVQDSVAVTTIVSSAMADAIAADHGFELRRVLTGFKYIGEQIAQASAGHPERFMFGFEESLWIFGRYPRARQRRRGGKHAHLPDGALLPHAGQNAGRSHARAVRQARLVAQPHDFVEVPGCGRLRSNGGHHGCHAR